MKQHLKTLYIKLVQPSSGDKSYKESVELANCYPSLAEPESWRLSRRQPETLSIMMLCGAGTSVYTLGKDESIIMISAQFVDH